MRLYYVIRYLISLTWKDISLLIQS